MSSKPLPSIPSTPILPQLSVEGNVLISSLIRQLIHEEDLDDVWIEPLLSAISTFGDYFNSPGILNGLKITRVLEQTRKLSSEHTERRPKEQERPKDLKGSRGKASDKPKEPDADALQERASTCVAEATKLKEIHDLALNRLLEFPSDCPHHLVLTARGNEETQELDGDRNVTSINQSCMFIQDEFSMPFFVGDDSVQQGNGGVLLCGLENWSLQSGIPLQIVGGTFVFHDSSYSATKESLLSVLRMTIYIYLSIILEQHLLENFQVVLKYPEIQARLLTPPLIPPQLPESNLADVALSPLRISKPRSNLWKYISKKTGGLLNRITEGPAMLSEALSPRARDIPSVVPSGLTPRSSLDHDESVGSEGRVLTPHSFAAESAVDLAQDENRLEENRLGPFTSTVHKIQSSNYPLTTSLSVTFPLPQLILNLSEREELQRLGNQAHSTSNCSSLSSYSSVTPPEPNATIKLTGMEKTGLGSIVGWDGREARGKGMVGIKGFVRHQGLTALYSRYVLNGETKHVCTRPKLVHYRYWSRTNALDAERDQSIGDFVRHLCDPSAMLEICDNEGCGISNGKHVISWICSGIKISATVGVWEGEQEKDEIIMWRSCKACGAQSEQVPMTDGTYLYSFSKFLELLLWSPIISSSPFCEHTLFTPSSTTPSSMSKPQLHALWHFAHKTSTCVFSLESVAQSLYTVRLPKLQIVNPINSKEEKRLQEAKKMRDVEQERHALATEIENWWASLRNRVDKLNAFLAKEVEQAANSKDLPPLPVSDDEDSEDEDSSDTQIFKRDGSPMAQLKDSTSISSSQISVGSKQSIWRNFRSLRMVAAYPPEPAVPFGESLKLLAQLKQVFDKMEESLHQSLQQTSISCLNDVRRAFRSSARGALKRLIAWQMKHAPGAPAKMHQGDSISSEPEWWRSDCHPVPGGRFVVREGESGSIIAFTLSSLDYQRELANLSASHAPNVSSAASTPIHASQPSEAGSVLTIKPSKSRPLLDPDDPNPAMWEESETCLAVVTRKDHPKEPTLLGLRDALRTKKSFDSNVFGSRFSNSISRNTGGISPPYAWAPALVQVNFEAADGQVTQFPEAANTVGRTLETQFSTNHASQGSDGSITPTSSSFVERHIRRGGDSTILTMSSQSFPDLDSEEFRNPPVAPKPTVPATTPSISNESSDTQTESVLGGTLSSALRYLLGNSHPPSRAPSPASSTPHHKLLAYEPLSTIDDHPHIKYDWTIGQRMKFSCTVYYAKQFDTLRKRCGVDIDVIKSLERSENWVTTGGKSKSNFWKSLDDRFIIKTLLNAWNVADLQVLIDLAPSYFRYLDATANKASALAKLMGFYTVEIKNIETGAVQKHDLLIMENLFYKHKVSKTYDLKGIQSRRAKPNSESTDATTTLLDGDWIEDQRCSSILVHAFSGFTLQEALKADTEFLSKSNIMDYSLLLGIDSENRELSCGLVDTIGSYTFAKTIEYKAKHNLTPNKTKEVTVIPPTEYQARFIGSMENYFLLCPDKWTKPPRFIDRTKVKDLPDIL